MTRSERVSTNPNHFVGNHPLINSDQLDQYYSEPEDGRYYLIAEVFHLGSRAYQFPEGND